MRKFSQVLEEYLQERDRQNSDYYVDRFIACVGGYKWKIWQKN